MAARALGSATIAFGLVSIPVKLYSAAESSVAIRFNQLDRRDGARVKQQLISSRSGELVPKDEIVKGYEFAKGQYVMFTAEELKALEAASTHAVEIDEFLPADSIDRIYFDKAYYLGPDKGGARAYRLLAEALTHEKRIAVGRYAARGRMHVVAVRPVQGKGLLLEQLHYGDEIRSFSEVPLDEVEVRDAELELAKQLIAQAAGERFEPSRYRDEVRDRMLEMINRKVEGEGIATSVAEQPEHKIIDLMEALKASLSTPDGRKPAKQAAAAEAPSKGASKPAAKKASKKKRASG